MVDEDCDKDDEQDEIDLSHSMSCSDWNTGGEAFAALNEIWYIAGELRAVPGLPEDVRKRLKDIKSLCYEVTERIG